MDEEILLKPVVAEVVKRGFSILEEFSGASSVLLEEFEPALGEHLQIVANWCSEVQFFEMPTAAAVEHDTIPLTITSIPRKFRGPGDQAPTISEEHLFEGNSNFLLLGDPGAGKTTTLKRLAQRMLQGDSVGTNDIWQYPIVILLRELRNHTSIVPVLAERLGIPHSTEAKWLDNSTGHEYKPEDLKGFFSQEYMEKNMAPRFYHMAGNGQPLVNALASFLDESSALVLLDGLDEIPRKNQTEVGNSIKDLARRLGRSKIVLSCRSGDFQENFEGFRVVEICGLSTDQILDVATRWLEGDAEEFLRRIRGTRLEEFSTRPLFLCHLIVLFQNTGDLPERPVSIYQKLSRLLLEDWDRHRGVARGSRYADFGPERKIEFLAAFAYQLTYEYGASRFSSADLVRIYRNLCRNFHLPENEARRVAGEIESHTGLIVESGPGAFEFVHLTFQEFLAGYYIVRRPFQITTRRNMESSAGPVALAICLSSEPSEWFSQLFLSDPFYWELDSVDRLVARLRAEQPIFSVSDRLGLAVMRVALAFGDDFCDALRQLLELDSVADSIYSVLPSFDVKTILEGAKWELSVYYQECMISGELTSTMLTILKSQDVLRNLRVDEGIHRVAFQ